MLMKELAAEPLFASIAFEEDIIIAKKRSHIFVSEGTTGLFIELDELDICPFLYHASTQPILVLCNVRGVSLA